MVGHFHSEHVACSAMGPTGFGKESPTRTRFWLSDRNAGFGPPYTGLRTWTRYIGVKMPSRPASASAAAQRFKVLETRTVPCGTMRSASSARNEPVVTERTYLVGGEYVGTRRTPAGLAGSPGNHHIQRPADQQGAAADLSGGFWVSTMDDEGFLQAAAVAVRSEVRVE